jgi:lipopolysaccharide export system ATP-binding protein
MNNTENYEIVVKNINKSFGKRQILNDINLSFSNKEIVGLLGPNGSGKTTLFYIIAGIIYGDSGSVLINKQNVTQYPIYLRAKMGLGYLPQDSSIFKKMTVAENILSVLELSINNKKDRMFRLDELLEQFHILHIKNSPATALSGGERRRVEIARCVANNPKFILLDEPFAGVDPLAISDLSKLIISLKQQNIGILITDHSVDYTLAVVDKAHVMYNGSIVFSGNKDEVKNSDIVKKVYLGDH